MPIDKRQRQKEGRRVRLEAERKATAQSRRNRIVLRLAILVAIVLIVVLAISVFSGDDGGNDTVSAVDTQLTDTQPITTAAPTTTAVPATTTTLAAVESPAVTFPATTTTVVFPETGPECPAEDGSSPPAITFDGPPPLCIDLETVYEALFITSVGNFTIELYPALDAASVNNFVFLARHHYYDGSVFHRVINGFVVQGGDPTGNSPGTGGPGYAFTGGKPAPGAYQLGSLAMANSGSDPSTNGSQFFIVTGPSGEGLPADFSLFGQVTSGLEVPLAIQAVETGPGDTPIEPVVVFSVTITEAP